MIMISADPRLQAAISRAHEERGAFMRWLFGAK